MSMRVIHQGDDEEEKPFPMNLMNMGDVCYCPETKDYVLAVAHGGDKMFLILGNCSKANTYSGKCSLAVRRLHVGGSITIKFS